MNTEPDAEVVTYERRGHVALVTLNRPERMNAVSGALASALGLALEDAEADAEVRVIIVTGAGDRAFCAGADLRELAAGRSIAPEVNPDWAFAGLVRHNINKPLIAAVNGVAFGGGLEIVLASDLAVAAERARFGLPEVTVGIIASAGGLLRLAKQLPSKLALELVLTGKPVGAPRAAELGLINSVVPDDQLLERAFEMAETIAANAPLAVQASRRVLRSIADAADRDWTLNDSERARIMATEDAKEGPRAFAERRPPVWGGR